MGDKNDTTGVAPTALGSVIPTEAHTEMAGLIDAETGLNHAWALDSGSDEIPSGAARRMTPRRITTIAVVASLAAAAFTAFLGFGIVRDDGGQATVQSPEATAGQTVDVARKQDPPSRVAQPDDAAPSTGLPRPTDFGTPDVRRAREESLLSALNGTPTNGPNHLSYSMIPGSHGAYMGDSSAWTVGGPVVKYAYRACEVLRKNADDPERATAVFYGEHGYDTQSVDVSTRQEMATYMGIVEMYLCD